MKGRVCQAEHDGLRCWMREHSGPDHWSVRPNHDTNINQHPVIVTWTEEQA